MFTKLIASRPAGSKENGGLAVSVALHGSVIAALFLVGPEVMDGKTSDDPRPPIIFVDPTKPATPPPSEPVRQRAPAPVTTDAPTLPTTPAPSIEVPVDVPVGIPEPQSGPWTAPSPSGVPGGTGTDAPAGSSGSHAGPDRLFTDDMVERPAELHQRSPLPQYPSALSSMRIEGGVRIRFVVDTLGRVEKEGIEVIESSHPAFEAAVRMTLPRMRFRPARVDGRAVRQLVEFPIAFKAAP